MTSRGVSRNHFSNRAAFPTVLTISASQPAPPTTLLNAFHCHRGQKSVVEIRACDNTRSSQIRSATPAGTFHGRAILMNLELHQGGHTPRMTYQYLSIRIYSGGFLPTRVGRRRVEDVASVCGRGPTFFFDVAPRAGIDAAACYFTGCGQRERFPQAARVKMRPGKWARQVHRKCSEKIRDRTKARSHPETRCQVIRRKALARCSFIAATWFYPVPC